MRGPSRRDKHAGVSRIDVCDTPVMVNGFQRGFQYEATMSNTSRLNDAALLCSMLFRAGEIIEVRPIEIWTDGDSGKRKSRVLRSERRWLAKDGFVEQLRYLDRLNTMHNANIFFGVNPRVAHGRGRKTDVVKTRCLWADMDNVTSEVAKWRCEETGVPHPSIIVDSGNGNHLYWLLDQTLDISLPFDRDLLEARLRRLYKQLGCDATCDANRLLRLPGFLNVKNARNGAQPTRCSLRVCNPDCRFAIESFPPHVKRQSPQSLQDGRVRRTFANQPRTTDPLTQRLAVTTDDRSKRDFAIVCSLLRAGYGKEEIRQAVASQSKFADRGDSYFETTFRNALIAIQS
ncbi:hypothetical protein CEE69_11985 [Rhodopirellula bahusiensis]|uniref:RepB-like DNA primase domain-containing protein n=2 Tax=Rhodopirellula bahusiensis TaxID=2014065 RepID=A0A2G1W7Z3_9BACT|nr:hypothetical protein CEE69_11985 [Rhodopirellula bahusiensis]